MYLSEFLLHYAKSECLKLGLMILKQQKSFKSVVVGLIKRHPNTLQAQKEWMRKCPVEIEQQFERLVNEVRALEAKL